MHYYIVNTDLNIRHAIFHTELTIGVHELFPAGAHENFAEDFYISVWLLDSEAMATSLY